VTSEQDTILAFLERINAHDADALTSMLTEDHVFTDSLGNAMCGGRAALRDAWRAYFELVPDYRIDIDHIVQDGALLVLLGSARGTCVEGGALSAENHWLIPAAWIAEVRGGLVSAWRVYADNTPVAAILQRIRSASRR